MNVRINGNECTYKAGMNVRINGNECTYEKSGNEFKDTDHFCAYK